MDYSTLANLIRISPFIVAAFLFAMAIRAIAKGQVKAGGARSHVRTVVRSSSPIEFWVEIGLYCGVAIFFVLWGLLFCNHAPHWFRAMVLNSHKHS